MEPHDGHWLYSGTAASRLWEKSAIGLLNGNGGLVLSDAEVIFCMNHRGIDIPSDEWLPGRVHSNPSLLQEAAILEALRVPGNKIVLHNNLDAIGISHSGSWALRWTSNSHPSKDDPVAEVLWYFSKDSLEIQNKSSTLSDWDGSGELETLLRWSESVCNNGRIAEILVIDEEQSVVTYRIQEVDPRGKLEPPTARQLERIAQMPMDPLSWAGSFIATDDYWPSEAIGIPLHGGRQLDTIESQIFSSIVSDTGVEEGSVSSSVLLDLWNRGLNTRSGFKYGTTWRCYSGKIGEGHAPWLVVDPSREGPIDWAEACLSSRLASGVNKQWLYPIYDNGKWRYLEISRPPSDSRWSNPNRH